MAKMASLHAEKNQVTQITEDQWDARYIPITHTPVDKVDNFVPDRHVWTLVDVDGDLYIVNGYATVNKIGYHITENKWALGEYIEVKVGE